MMKLPDEPKEGFPVIEWTRKLIAYLRATRITSVIGGRLRESASGTTLEIIPPKERRTSPTKPPLWVTLRAVPAETVGDPPTWEVLTEYGHVVPSHNASSETGAPIEITSLPTPDAPLAVIEDDKLWVELTIDVEGKCTAAAFDSGTTWPDDDPPILAGGDLTGTAGERFIRIAEIIANPDSTTTPPSLIREQLHTGHIDYAQPTLAENLTSSPSGGEARIMKQWNATSGRWDFRYLVEGDGVTITENADTIEIEASASHPWKCTPTGTADIDVAQGYVFFVNPKGSPGTDMKPFIYAPEKCEADSLTVTGTGYIYAVVGTSGSPEMVGGIESAFGTGSNLVVYVRGVDAITLQFSTDDPQTFDPSGASFAYAVAKVGLVGGDAVVLEQYLTSNPTHELVYVIQDT